MFLLIFIYALIGMQFFSDELTTADEEPSRYTFETFVWSLITIFIILTGENWNEVMYIVIRRYGIKASFYFVSLMVFGNFMLLNLFLAILLKYISDNVEEELNAEDDEAEEESLRDDDLDLIQRTIKQQTAAPDDLGKEPEDAGRQDQTGGTQIQPVGLGNELAQLEEFRSMQKSRAAAKKKGKGKSKDFYKIEIYGRSMFLMNTKNGFRRCLKALIEHPYFENMIYYFIGLNSLLLVVDEPFLEEGYEKSTVNAMISVITAIFILEAVLKILVLGFICGKGTYLRDSWNVMDFFIVLSSIINWSLAAVGGADIGFLRGFRALRALRPLRMVSKNEGMKSVVNSLLKSIPQLFNVLLISVLFYLVFGILGVQVFKGAIARCTDGEQFFKTGCVGTFINN